MELDEILVKEFDRIVNLEVIPKQKIQHWEISSYVKENEPGIDITYNPKKGSYATYLFGIESIEPYIIFRNRHRKAEKGDGTPSLKEMERAFYALALDKKLPVVVVFKTRKKNVRKWLEKNEYKLLTLGPYKGFYMKLINP